MKGITGGLLLAGLVPLVAVAQKDWRQMERKRIVNQVSSLQLKNGLDEVG